MRWTTTRLLLTASVLCLFTGETALGQPKGVDTIDSAIIVSTKRGDALNTGSDILRAGGSAADAASAIAIHQIVQELGSIVSFAGIMDLLYFDSSTGIITSMNAGYNTPLLETDPLSIPTSTFLDKTKNTPEPSGRTALVPGFIAGVEAAHQRFGKVPFSMLFQAGIAAAQHGIVVSDDDVKMLEMRRDVLSRRADTRRIFTDASGEFPKAGQILRQQSLADTLRKISLEGATYFYEGDWARKFVDKIQSEGGKINLQDMSSYSVEWSAPLHTRHGSYDVFAFHQAHSMLGMLNLIEVSGALNSGPVEGSPLAFHWLHRIFRATGTNMDLIGENINRRAVDPGRWLRQDVIEETWAELLQRDPPREHGRAASPQHSHAIVVIDFEGNIATLVHSINTLFWGETGIFVDGISIPDSAAFQQHGILKAGPGNKLPNFVPLSIVLRDGQPVIATSAMGSALHQETAKVLVGVLDHGLKLQDAIGKPSLLEPAQDVSGRSSREQVVEGDYSQPYLADVRSLGTEVDEITLDTAQFSAGWVIAVTIDEDDDRLVGVPSRFGGDSIVVERR